MQDRNAFGTQLKPDVTIPYYSNDHADIGSEKSCDVRIKSQLRGWFFDLNHPLVFLTVYRFNPIQCLEIADLSQIDLGGR
jgi:hypothetical protein